MIKLAIAGAIAMVMVSFGVNAAPTTPQGEGRVTFNGTIVDAPCGVSQKSADQSIDFGQPSKSFLASDGQSKPMNLDIELVNCDVIVFKSGNAKAGSIKLAFTGPTVSGRSSELATNGDMGTAIMIQAAGESVPSGDTEGNANLLKNGDNVLHYTAVVKKSSDGNVQITEGASSVVATFNLSYQ